MDASRRPESRGAVGAAARKDSRGAVGKVAHKAGRGSEELCNALRSLLSIAADLCWNAFGHPLPPFPHHAPSTLLRALQRVHTEEFSTRLYETVGAGSAGADSKRAHRDAVDVVRLYAPYVGATYDGAPAGQCPESVGNARVVFGDYEPVELWSPCFYVAKDEELKRFVVAVRGTANFNDVVTDILGDTVPFGDVDGAVAHRGFVKASKGILNKIRPVLKSQLASSPGYSVTVCGHSLGAGCSSLLLKLMQDEGCYGEDLMAVAIACPPCFAPLEAVDARWADALYAYVHADDIVPRASLFTLRNLLLHFCQLNKLKLKARKVDDLSVTELNLPPPRHGKPVYWKRRCVQMPGFTANCSARKCQELTAKRQRDDMHAEEHGTYPAGYDHARSRRTPLNHDGKKSCEKEEHDEDLQRSRDSDSEKRPLESEDGERTALESASFRKRLAANAAAESRYLSLLKHTHHHKEDVKEIPELVIPAPRGVHWIIPKAAQRDDLTATINEVSTGVSSGGLDHPKSEKHIGREVPDATDDRGRDESNSGCFPKSGGLRRKMSLLQSSSKQEASVDGNGGQTKPLDEENLFDGKEEETTYFSIQAVHPRSLQPTKVDCGSCRQ